MASCHNLRQNAKGRCFIVFLLFETYTFEFRAVLFYSYKLASFSIALHELLSHWVVGLAALSHGAYAMTISDRVILCHIKHLLFVWLFFVIRSSDQNDLGQCISTLFQVTWYWNKQVLVNLKNVVRFVVTRITHRDNVPRFIYQTIFLNMASIKMASGRISPATRTLKENDWIFVSFPICQPRVFSC